MGDRLRFHWDLDWSNWLFGVEVDSDLHWTRDQRITNVSVYVGPVMLDFEFWGREK